MPKKRLYPKKRAYPVHVDSLNLSKEYIEDKFMDERYYKIEPIKGIGIFIPHRWKNEFGKSITRNIIEGKCLHTFYGYSLPLKRYSATKNKMLQTVEFAGLRRYDERALYMNKILQTQKKELMDSFIPRIDIAIDIRDTKAFNKAIKNIEQKRPRKKTDKNTTYYKTLKEGNTNSTMDIKSYLKSKKENLSKKLHRIEFVFKGNYTKDYMLNNIDDLFEKIKKTIKRFTGLDVEIKPI